MYGDGQVLSSPPAADSRSTSSSAAVSEKKVPARRRRPPCAAPPDTTVYDDEDDDIKPATAAVVIKYVPRHLSERVRDGKPMPRLRMKHFVKWTAILSRLVAGNKRKKKMEPWQVRWPSLWTLGLLRE